MRSDTSFSAPPFRDRVVHHALCAVVQPILETGFIDHTFANRVDKGTHRAIETYERYRDPYAHVLRCDNYRYFSHDRSCDPEIRIPPLGHLSINAGASGFDRR